MKRHFSFPKFYTTFFFIFAFMTLMSSAFSQGKGRIKKLPAVLLLSIDGLMPEHLFQSEQYGLKIPHLKKFVQEGISAQGVKGVVPSLTYPSHATMVTGVNPNEHGIYNNGIFDPLGQHKDAWYWFSYEIKVPTLWTVAKEAGLKTASLDFPVSVGAEVDSLIVQYWRDNTALDRLHVKAFSTKGLLDEMESVLGPYPVGQWHLQSDQKRLDYLLYLWEKKKPDFMTAYFSSVDENAHRHGPFANETLRTIEGIDELIGQILKGIQEREKSSEKEVIICIVSDHGFASVHSQVRLNALLRKKGTLEVDEAGKVKSWQAYAWEGQGMAAIMINPQLKEQASEFNVVKEKVRAILDEFMKEHPEVIESLWEGEKIRATGGFAEADFLLMGKSGFQFSPSLEDPVVGAKPNYKATHGFSPEHSQMDAVFLMKGSSSSQLPRGKNIGMIRMVDIAPTLAQLLGLRLENAQGQSVLP